MAETNDEGWPDAWESATDHIEDDGATMTNDHGILYLVGNTRDGEWMHLDDTLPPHLENRR